MSVRVIVERAQPSNNRFLLHFIRILVGHDALSARCPCRPTVLTEGMRASEMRSVCLVLLCVGLTAGCEGGRTTYACTGVTGGDARRGVEVIRQFGCGGCHTIPGVAAANGVVGPPLMFFSRRTYIAGELANTPDNLVRWVMDPPAVEPRTAMPKLGLNDQQARDVAAYLYTLK